MKDCYNDSSAFKLQHMKDAIVRKKKEQAERNGLDPNTIKCTISTETAKIAMTAVAMEGTHLGFTKKKLQTKTKS